MRHLSAQGIVIACALLAGGASYWALAHRSAFLLLYGVWAWRADPRARPALVLASPVVRSAAPRFYPDDPIWTDPDRSVAAGAKLFGNRCFIFLPKFTSAEKEARRTVSSANEQAEAFAAEHGIEIASLQGSGIAGHARSPPSGRTASPQ